MSPLHQLAQEVRVKASKNWLILIYIAAVVTATLALAVADAIQAASG